MNVSKENIMNILSNFIQNGIIKGLYDTSADKFYVKYITERAIDKVLNTISNVALSGDKIGWDSITETLQLPPRNFPVPNNPSECVDCQKKCGKFICTWCKYPVCEDCVIHMNLSESITSKISGFLIGIRRINSYPFCRKCRELGRVEHLF